MGTTAASAQPAAAAQPVLSPRSDRRKPRKRTGHCQAVTSSESPHADARVVAYQHGSTIAFCGEVLGEDFSSGRRGFVRFISSGGSAVLDSQNAAFTQQEQSHAFGNSLCEPQ